jgi:hypothetical protein
MRLGKDSQMAKAMLTRPVRLEMILDERGMGGTLISLSSSPPPKSPARSAMPPIMAMIVGTVSILTLPLSS